MCLWKQWKKTATRIINFVKLGMDKFHAYLNGNKRKKYCRIAQSGILNRILTNKYFIDLGYADLEVIYLKCQIQPIRRMPNGTYGGVRGRYGKYSHISYSIVITVSN
jgi:RNA-directed DNA polymerase